MATASTQVSALEQVLSRARSENRAALIGYIPAGFPTMQGFAEAIDLLIDTGFDALEY